MIYSIKNMALLNPPLLRQYCFYYNLLLFLRTNKNQGCSLWKRLETVQGPLPKVSTWSNWLVWHAQLYIKRKAEIKDIAVYLLVMSSWLTEWHPAYFFSHFLFFPLLSDAIRLALFLESVITWDGFFFLAVKKPLCANWAWSSLKWEKVGKALCYLCFAI